MKLITYGPAIFLIALGIGGILWSVLRYENDTTENTLLKRGVLSSFPEKKKYKNNEYIEISIDNSGVTFRFAGCSHSEHITERVMQLKPGDSVLLHVDPRPLSTGLFSDESSYQISEASSSRIGPLVSFDRFNSCSENSALTSVPLLCSMLVLLGILMAIRSFIDERNDKSMLSVALDEINDPSKIIVLRPDMLAYIMRNSTWPGIMIICGLFVNTVLDGQQQTLGLILFGGGLYLILYYTLTSRFEEYSIDERGIHIKSKTLYFTNYTQTITYSEILDVQFRRAVYESPKHLGTVVLTLVRKKDEEDLPTVKLAGITDAQKIARRIWDRANAAPPWIS